MQKPVKIPIGYIRFGPTIVVSEQQESKPGLFAATPLTDTGTGDWSINLGIAQDLDKLSFEAEHIGAGARSFSFVKTSTTAIQVLGYDAATPSAADMVTELGVTIYEMVG